MHFPSGRGRWYTVSMNIVAILKGLAKMTLFLVAFPLIFMLAVVGALEMIGGSRSEPLYVKMVDAILNL